MMMDIDRDFKVSDDGDISIVTDPIEVYNNIVLQAFENDRSDFAAYNYDNFYCRSRDLLSMVDPDLNIVRLFVKETLKARPEITSFDITDISFANNILMINVDILYKFVDKYIELKLEFNQS
jgi:hypothetical protein